jgi:transcriptional regulator with XRE-family HTH domain
MPTDVIPRSERLGLRIQARRRELGYRFAKDLAAAMGWNASMLSRLESGERGLTERDVEQLARHLQVSRSWFGEEPTAEGGLVVVADLIERMIELRREEVTLLERVVDLLRREREQTA